MTSGRRHPTARSRPATTLTLVLAGLATLLVAAGAGVAPGAAVAAQPPGGPPAGASAQTGPAIELVEQPTWVREGERFDVTVRVSGAPAGATVDMAVHDVLESRDDFRSSLEDELGDVLHRVGQQPAPAGAGGTATVGFSPDDPGTRLASRGVYPVEVRLLSSGGETLDRFVTYLSYLRGDLSRFTPLSTAVLVDVAADPALRPDGTTVLPTGALARVQERIDVLQRAPGVALTVAPRPETVEALAAGGPQETAAVRDLAALAADHPVLARPFVDVDPEALDRNGLLGEVSAQTGAGANVIRSRLAVEPTGGMWLSGATLGDRAARRLADIGIGHVVVPLSALGRDDDDEPESVPETPVQLGDTGATGLVADPDLAEHLTSGDGVIAAHRFVAELVSKWLEAPSNPRAVVVHLPAEADLDVDVVGTALAALADGEAVRATTVDQIFRDVPAAEDGPTTVSLADHDVGDDLAAVAPRIGEPRDRLAGAGALLADPAQVTALEHALLVATGTDTPDDQRAAYVERAAAALGALAGAVTLPEEFRITLTSRSSSIPVALTNISNREVHVQVVLDSDQLEFPDGATFPALLAPDTTTRIDVPVRSRTSGAFSLDVTVTSPDGTLVLDESTFDIRSTAISGVGLVLSAGAGLFLAVWWARHWRSARRSRRLMPTDGPAGGPPAGVGDPSPPARGPTGAHTATAAGIPDDHAYRPAHMARQRTRSGSSDR